MQHAIENQEIAEASARANWARESIGHATGEVHTHIAWGAVEHARAELRVALEVLRVRRAAEVEAVSSRIATRRRKK